MLDIGFAAGTMNYGGGLFISNVNMTEMSKQHATLDEITGCIGHEGVTYGYHSENFFFPNMNFSMSIIVDTDFTMLYPKIAQCSVT